VDGHWYEIDTDLPRAASAGGSANCSRSGPTWLCPTWRAGQSERTYNENAALDPDLRLVCLDRKGVQDEFHTHWGFEACDLLGPGNELIHVKKASGPRREPPLHAGLCSDPSLEGFRPGTHPTRELVQQHGRGRELPPDFKPTKIVFGILLKAGEEITPHTLFPFLAGSPFQAARLLQSSTHRGRGPLRPPGQA